MVGIKEPQLSDTFLPFDSPNDWQSAVVFGARGSAIAH
jgi:hypothetical protein